MRTFRSLVIPLTAIVLNLLSVGAAYGVLKLVFQEGHLQSLLGFAGVGGVIDWLSLFLFVILVGPSMEYHGGERRPDRPVRARERQTR